MITIHQGAQMGKLYCPASPLGNVSGFIKSRKSGALLKTLQLMK